MGKRLRIAFLSVWPARKTGGNFMEVKGGGGEGGLSRARRQP